MSAMKHITKITLYNSYFDLNNNISAKAVLNIFQDVASIHGEEIGVGYLDMLSKNLYWVLSRIKFDILKMPEINQTVIVETWPHEKGRIDFDRDMKILSENGEPLIIATSKWCIIDTVNRTLQRTDNIVFNGEYINEKNYEDKFLKITLPYTESKYVYTYQVRFCDLDHNHHMNNTNYANLISNVTKSKIFTHFEINFLNECIDGDKIDIHHIIDNKKEYVIGSTENKTYFTALVY
ncbi:MAG: hypothetical protein J6J33_02280 [Clostridia bacterium]|nr:hypothetical protein [Clostridia bacterium]